LNDIVEKHPESEMAPKARELLEKLRQDLKPKANAAGGTPGPSTPNAGAKKPDLEGEPAKKGRRRRENK
jgi:hypothetical protein